MMEDLRWFGFTWQEGPDCGGPFGPYQQSERHNMYLGAFEMLRQHGLVYPCACSRKEVASALSAPHPGDEEPVYPGTCRPDSGKPVAPAPHSLSLSVDGRRMNWRLRVPDGETITFLDGHFGRQQFVAGRDFGDFVVWRSDDFPSYQLAVVVDDHGMGITEVVRGADLLLSTARQWLLYRALGWEAPAFFHCPLMTDAQGVRLAKRHDALSLRTLRGQGASPESLRATW
jgi:glutamyl-tRNA synthetase